MTRSPPDEHLAACAAEPETDIGNGRRLLTRFGGDIRHVTHVGWHAYDGRRWKEDESGAITRRLAHRTAEAIFDEAGALAASAREADILDAARVAQDMLDTPFDNTAAMRAEIQADIANRKAWRDAVDRAEPVKADLADRRSRRRRHAKSTCGTAKLNNMLQEAAAYRATAVGDLNRDHYAVNVGNGTLRFYRTEDEESDPDDPRYVWRVRLDEHDRRDLISKLANADYLPEAPPAALWEKFLVRVQPSPDMRDYLQRLAGYCLLGLNSEQMIAFFYGIGRNGKSTFVDCLRRLLADYAVTTSIDSFTGENRRSGSEATPDLARLPGARFVAASEPEQGVRLKESLVKHLTGGEPMAVRRLNEDFFEFDPQFTLIISGNHKMTIVGDDDGIWRRIHFVPWNEQIPRAEVDKELPRKLDTEAGSILKWAVDGALAFLDLKGLNPPRDVVDATQDYREEQDPVGTFLRNACDITGDADDSEKPFDLFAAYERFAIAAGIIKVKETTFYRRLPSAAMRSFPSPDGVTLAQFHKAKTMGAPIYRGIRIRDEWLAKGLPEQHERESR